MDLAAELAFFVFEEEVEGGERSIAAGDVLLHLDFLGIAEFVVRVDLLLQDAEVVADHRDLVEEHFQRNLL